MKLKELIHTIHGMRNNFLIELSFCCDFDKKINSFDIQTDADFFNKLRSKISSLNAWSKNFETDNMYFYKNNLAMAVHTNGKEICFNNVCHKAFYFINPNKSETDCNKGIVVRIIKNNPISSRLFPFTNEIDYMENVIEDVYQNSTITFKFETHTYNDGLMYQFDKPTTYKCIKMYVKNTINTDYYLDLFEPEFRNFDLDWEIQF
jgi:hypothetical protein